MADLDFIDQIVDQCLGSNTSSPAVAAPAPVQQQQQRPMMAQPQYQQQQQQYQHHQPSNHHSTNTSVMSAPSPPPRAAQPLQQQQQQQQYYPPQQQQPSASQQAMPSPVPRDAHYSAQSVPVTHSSNANGNGNYPQHDQQAAFAGGGGYTSGGGRPQEYHGAHYEPVQFFGGNSSAYGGGGATSNGSPVGGDAALRRIQMWEEKKRLKAAMAKRDQMSRGDEECTFRPNIQAARDSVLANKLGLTNPKGTKGTVGFGYGGGNNGLTVGGRVPKGASLASPTMDDHHNATQRSVTAQSVMSPSRLYKDNKAWGYDSFVDRQIYAREMRRQAEEDAAAVFALKNPEGRNLRVTVPEPFEFGNKGRKTVRQALASPANAIAQQIKREQPEFYAEDSSIYDPHHSSSGAYFDDSDYHSRQYRASDALTAPSVPAGLFSLHASNMMLEHTGESPISPPTRR